MLRRYLFFALVLIFTVNCMLLSLPLAAAIPRIMPDPPEPTAPPVARRVPSIGINVGERAPDFTLLSLDGNAFTLSEMHGQVTVINFWASWVGPSRVEMPMLQTFFDLYSDEGLNIVGIAFADNPATAVELTRTLGITYEIVVDNTEVSTLYQIQSLPATYVLDDQGVIVYKHFGVLSASDVQENILPLLD